MTRIISRQYYSALLFLSKKQRLPIFHGAIEHFKQVEKKLPLSSIETTHGVIKLCTDKPIIFVSAIADRLGHFDTEVTATQNYISSFNAGIVLGQLFCSLNELVINGFRFER